MGTDFFSTEELSYEHTLNENGPGENNWHDGSTCGKCGGCGQCGSNCSPRVNGE